VAEREPVADPADRVLRIAENVVYAVAGVLLAAGAVAVLGAVSWHLVKDLGKGVERSVTVALDGLLLVFILLELLAGVRATMKERKLVAEPFLIVGIIASIKEIVVLTLESKEIYGSDTEAFRNAMTEIGVLAGVILLLALAGFLVRRKEREPEEEDEAAGK
jgi:uncharacterized membrane protein (DUF373 family)